jgi:hypothetical protein
LRMSATHAPASGKIWPHHTPISAHFVFYGPIKIRVLE